MSLLAWSKHLLRHLTTSFSSFLCRQQYPPSHFIRRNNSICNVITLAHTLTLLIQIKFWGDYLRIDSLYHYLTFKLNFFSLLNLLLHALNLNSLKAFVSISVSCFVVLIKSTWTIFSSTLSRIKCQFVSKCFVLSWKTKFLESLMAF
jgi:hypothetical protein